MALQIQGSAGEILKADGSVWNALRTSNKPLDYAAGGHYRNAMRTGTIAAVCAANAILYTFRNPTASGVLSVILRVRAQFFANIAATAAFNDMSCRMHVTRGYTTLHSTNGTAATLTGNMGKLRTSMATAVSQIRTLTTVNAGITGGTGTDDTDPMVISSIGKPNVVNAAAGTEYLAAQPNVTLEYEPDMGDGAHPLVLAADEGFVIRNGLVWPAAGTGVFKCEVQWCEVNTF